MAHSSAELAEISRRMDEIIAKATAEGALDDQFTQLLSLQDDSNPDFVSEVAALYFSDSTEKLNRLVNSLSQVTDPVAQRDSWAPAVDAAVHQFKGASASFGAAAVAAACVRVRAAAMAGDFAQVCELLTNQVRAEFEGLRVRMGEYQQLDAKRKALLNAVGGVS